MAGQCMPESQNSGGKGGKIVSSRSDPMNSQLMVWMLVPNW